VTLAVLAGPLLTGRQAAADPVRWHLELGGAHALGDPQGREFGPGTEGSLAAEIPLARAFGLQLEGGSLWLAHAMPPADPSIADHGDGSAAFAMGGARLRPFSDVAGAWIDASAGYVRTGMLDRFGFDAHVGFDWRVGDGRWDVGPYVGYFQIVQPGDALRPEDSHVVSIGLHVALGAPRLARPAAPAALPPAIDREPPMEPPSDRDGDGIVDGEDACPDVPGVPSDVPSLNGCPPPDTVRVVDDRIEYGEAVLFDTGLAQVTPAAWPVLRHLAAFITANPRMERVVIGGHADERGAEDYNQRLSQARASAIREILISFGIDPARLTAEGFGFSRPRAQGHTEDDWRQNRRVEFRIAKMRDAQEPADAKAPAQAGARP
jgi:outer membrane protein OmpA-like peptidoglycan-associated protein